MQTTIVFNTNGTNTAIRTENYGRCREMILYSVMNIIEVFSQHMEYCTTRKWNSEINVCSTLQCGSHFMTPP